MQIQPDEQTSENTIKHFVEESFEATHNLMKADRERRFKYSGTTMVLVVVHNNVIYFCNAGDSRAILGSVASDSQSSECLCTFETQLHKPELPEEEERIKSFGGIVSPYLDEETGEFLGPQRVWNSVRREPGLATSRTLGDVLAHSLGVTFRPGKSWSYPEIHIRQMNSSDRVMVLASDGVWDFLESPEILDICNSAPGNPEIVAKKIVQTAADRWAKVNFA